MNHITLSIVVPCYKEQDTIPHLLERYKKTIGERTDIELIVVNDGSKDDTAQVLEQEKGKYSFLRVVTVTPNAGYGNAVYTGLKEAHGTYIGWTHGDLQTPPEDTLRALSMIEENKNSNIYIKGKRYGRPLFDVVFTFGMSVFETLLFRTLLVDINAQPNIFKRDFLKVWNNPPKDFSLGLYVYLLAKNNGYTIIRFPVYFGARFAGVSSWNTSWKNKYKFIKRTINFSLSLLQEK